MEDTIVAISTSLGVGAISIIRVSGKKAINIVNKLFSKDLSKKESHTVTYGYIKDKDEIIDEVLVTIMKAPKTFTCEDVVEINCHGGIATTKKVLSLLLNNGCRMAEPGEFTKRAFLNGRIDLTQAEAVMDLINTKSDNARKIALSNLTGSTTNKIKELRKQISDILTNIEVNIDYPEYLDIEVMTIEKVKDIITKISLEIDKLIKNSKNSDFIRNGIDIAIIGRPNVGKSSILNKLLGEEKAIVTDIPGTTRDIVEGIVNLDGLLLNLIDTAGIRESIDTVEKIGIEKSKQSIEKADLVILVLNNNEKLSKEDLELIKLSKNKKLIIVINKNDLSSRIDKEALKNYIVVESNTINEDGIDKIKDKIKELFDIGNIEIKDFNYVTNTDSIKKLEECKKLVQKIEKDINNNVPIDMIEIYLKNIWQLLGEIIGEVYTDELLDDLFKNFCVGK